MQLITRLIKSIVTNSNAYIRIATTRISYDDTTNKNNTGTRTDNAAHNTTPTHTHTSCNVVNKDEYHECAHHAYASYD